MSFIFHSGDLLRVEGDTSYLTVIKRRKIAKFDLSVCTVHSPLGVSLIPRWRLNNIDSRDATIKIASCRNAVQGTQPEEILEIIHPSIESGVEAEMEKRD